MKFPAKSVTSRNSPQELDADSGSSSAVQEPGQPGQSPFALPPEKEKELSSAMNSAVNNAAPETQSPAGEYENPFAVLSGEASGTQSQTETGAGATGSTTGEAVSPEPELPSATGEKMPQDDAMFKSIGADPAPTPTLSDLLSQLTIPWLIGPGVLLGLLVVVWLFRRSGGGAAAREMEAAAHRAPLATKLKERGDAQDAVSDSVGTENEESLSFEQPSLTQSDAADAVKFSEDSDSDTDSDSADDFADFLDGVKDEFGSEDSHKVGDAMHTDGELSFLTEEDSGVAAAAIAAPEEILDSAASNSGVMNESEEFDMFDFSENLPESSEPTDKPEPSKSEPSKSEPDKLDLGMEFGEEDSELDDENFEFGEGGFADGPMLELDSSEDLGFEIQPAGMANGNGQEGLGEVEVSFSADVPVQAAREDGLAELDSDEFDFDESFDEADEEFAVQQEQESFVGEAAVGAHGALAGGASGVAAFASGGANVAATDNSVLQNRIEELTRDLVSSKEELGQANRELANAKMKLDDTSQSLSHARSKVEQETAALNRELADSSEELQSRDRELSAARKELEQLTEQMKNQAADESARAEQAKKALEDQLKQRDTELAQLQSDFDSANAKLKEAESGPSQADLDAEKEKLAQAKSELASVREELAAATSKLKEAESGPSQADLDAEKEKLAQAESELVSVREELATATSKLKEAESGPSQADLDAEKEKLAQAESELVSVREELAAATSKLKEAESGPSQADLDAEKEKLDQAESELVSVREELAAATSKLKEAESGPSQADLDAEKEKLDQAESELASVREELATATGKLKEAESGPSQADLDAEKERLGKTESELVLAKEKLAESREQIAQQRISLQQADDKLEEAIAKGRRYKLFAKKTLAKLENDGISSSELVNFDSAAANKRFVEMQGRMKAERTRRIELEELVQRRDSELADEISAREKDARQFETRLATAVQENQRHTARVAELEAKLE